MMLPAILPVVLLVALGATFTLLTRHVGKHLGHSPNMFGARDNAHDFVGRVYRVGGAVLFAFLVVRTAWPGADRMAGAITAMVQPVIGWTGFVIMAAGSVVIVAAQVQMGLAWRIGLDAERTGLVTTGLFAWSRNPTFLGMMAVVFGAFLITPTAVTAGIFVAAWVAFSVQIRMEEEHLLRMHDAAYERYRGAVPRWLVPGSRTGMTRNHNRAVNHG